MVSPFYHSYTEYIQEIGTSTSPTGEAVSFPQILAGDLPTYCGLPPVPLHIPHFPQQFRTTFPQAWTRE